MNASNNAHTFEGRCHCGAIGFSFRSEQAPEQWFVRACQCRFCRLHGARTTSDPLGSVIFHVANPEKLKRYRFESRTADFLICSECGSYIAALVTLPRGQFATLNVNAMADVMGVPETHPVSYDGESVEQRLERRGQRWTPVQGFD